MRPSWKLALICGEVTVLAAFTGVGIHLAMQPHRLSFRPPPLVLPSVRPGIIPALTTPLLPPPTPLVKAARPTSTPLAPDVFRRFGEQDRNLLIEQWDLLQRLTGAMERYVEARVIEQIDKKR